MKMIEINSVTDIKHGDTLVCPDAHEGLFQVGFETNFYIHKNGNWGIECPFCGDAHAIIYIKKAVNNEMEG